MNGQASLYPLEFFVCGTARAHSAGSRPAWQEEVRRAARERLRATDDIGFIDQRPVAVTIYYFLSEPMQGDIDNIVKPILDAMNAVAYPDDRFVERVVVQRFEPGTPILFTAVSEKFAEALGVKPPVVYIRVDDDLSWRRL